MPPRRIPFRLSWRSFNLQLVLVAILPLTILLVALVFGSLMLHHEAMRSLVAERDLRAVRATANSLNQELYHRAETIRMLANNLGESHNLEALSIESSRLQLVFDSGVALFSSEGQLLAATPGPLPWDSSPGLADALKDLVGQPAGGAAISRAFAPEPGGSLVALAGFNAGQNLLVGGFSPARLFEAGLAGAIDPSQATALVLAQRGGQVLYSMGIQDPPGQVPAHPGMADALEGQSGINYFQAADGEHVVAFSPVAMAGWALVIEEPWEKSASPFLNTTQAAPLVLLPVLVLAIIALWFGARRVIQPLQALENRAAALANGDFEAIQQPVGGISEIRQLQAELVDMAGKVKTAQESLHGYIGAMTAGTETERRSLARELHDDTIQSLIAINQRIQLALPNARDDAERSALVELQGLAQEAMTDLRRMIRGLRPIYLEDLGLAAALRMLAQEVSQSSGLPVQFQETGSERRLEPAVELAFYRMAQEALSNCAQHARARQARVELAFSPESMTLTVIDDGQGFEVPPRPGELAVLGHFGLLGLHERAELAGASLKITSSPGEGTVVTIRREG